MKQLFLIITIILLTVGSSTFAQTNPVPITGGRFFMQRGVQDLTNARIETSNFTAISWVSDAIGNSVWDICSLSSNPSFCRSGTTFSVPKSPLVDIGFCGACSPPQFPRGSFTINGTTYENAHFEGLFQFSQVEFLVTPMRVAKRKGLVRLSKPFEMKGALRVCRTAFNPHCTPENLIYSGEIIGQGTLTVTGRIIVDSQISPRPFLWRESIEYKFEP
ncbi:MAG TPA: hypothetical protein VK308_00385 [Pyrinomonadaceae bacterium]|nr:hypothetical protein [Pyrinomonadaceae bacterium]